MYVVLFRGHFYACDSPDVPGRTQRDTFCECLLLREVDRLRSRTLLGVVEKLVVRDVRGAVRAWNKIYPDDKITWSNVPVLRPRDERRKWALFD